MAFGPQKGPSSLSRILAQQKFLVKELPMLNFLIFSKNRACQLDLLLRNIRFLTLVNSSLYNINVLYTCDDFHKESYELCQHEHSTRVSFIKELDFESQTKELLRGIVCLLTDDTSFFRKFNLPFIPEENECFSWRLGYNTFIQNHVTGSTNGILVPDSYSDSIISWNPNKYPDWSNYGYPFSFDGHVYHSKTLLNILKDKQFKTTNDIEGILHSQRDKIQKITSNVHSSCVNIPCNNLSGLTEFGTKHYYSIQDLKDKYVHGYRIMPIQESKIPVIGCHQEFPFSFYKKG